MDKRQLRPTNILRVARRRMIESAWGRRTHFHLGSYLLSNLLAVAKTDPEGLTPAFSTPLITQKGKRVRYLRLTEAAQQVIADGEDLCGRLLPRHLPMVVPPMRWSKQDPGGYISLPLTLITKSTETHSGGDVGGIPRRHDLPKPVLPADFETNEASKKAWKAAASKVHQANARLRADRVLWLLRLEVARHFKDYKAFYFPHQLDFRGRYYAVPPYLNHQQDDLSRGLLEFAEGRPLGRDGLRWLLLHIANCCGLDRLPAEDRIQWVRDNEATLAAWVADPLENTGWLLQDHPFQVLAAVNAWRQGGPCHIPVQLDASNNGLQHYAALLRCPETARHVNLIPAEYPADLYSEVARKVGRRVCADAAKGDRLARQLEGHIDRKLVKRTVMTTVYGVTPIGARRQIQDQLGGIGLEEDDVYEAARYLARVTMETVATTCRAAAALMDWMAESARRIVRAGHLIGWVAPTGLPVVQNYRRCRTGYVRTILQRIYYLQKRDAGPPAHRRQINGFAPNYIHSLDAAHLTFVANRCRKAGITLASVHDSFWTHAADAEAMLNILREEFVRLHTQSKHPRGLIGELKDQLQRSYPGVKLPRLPCRGNFDVRQSLESRYCFS